MRTQIQSINIWLQLMEYGKALGCHQIPERSFTFKNYQFPVCARCTGVIISSVIAGIVFLKHKPPLKMCFGMSAVMLSDWLLQFFGILESTNTRRFLTGLIGGFGYSMLYFRFCNHIFDNIKKYFINKKSNRSEL